MRRSWQRILFALAMASALATTAAATAPTAVAASSTSATTTAKVKAAGVSLAYPKAWTAVPASSVALNKMVDALKKHNPKAAAALQDATKNGLSKQVKLYAIDLDQGTGDNLNVLALGPGSMPPSLSDFDAAIASQYKAINATVDDTSKVTVSGKTAYRADVSYPLKRDDGSTVTLRLGQVLVDTPKGIAVVTVTVGDDPAGSRIIDSVLSSVKVL